MAKAIDQTAAENAWLGFYVEARRLAALARARRAANQGNAMGVAGEEAPTQFTADKHTQDDPIRSPAEAN